MQVQALDHVILQDTLKSTALSATDWSNVQDVDSTIARVKTMLQRPRKPNARKRASKSPGIRRYLRDWAKLNVEVGVLYRSAIVKGDNYEQLVFQRT